VSRSVEKSMTYTAAARGSIARRIPIGQKKNRAPEARGAKENGAAQRPRRSSW